MSDEWLRLCPSFADFAAETFSEVMTREGENDELVIVDHRERGSGVPGALASLGFQVFFEQLPIGDYLIGHRLLFERKTLPDLAASIIDGRLFRQARRLVNCNPLPALILEGKARSLRNSKMSRESIQGALVSLSLVYGLPILRASDSRESARMIRFAAQQILLWRNRPLPRNRHRWKTVERMRLGVIESLPGIGPVRAASLLRHFQRVETVMAASAEELQKVEGVGPMTAQRLRWVVGSEAGEMDKAPTR